MNRQNISIFTILKHEQCLKKSNTLPWPDLRRGIQYFVTLMVPSRFTSTWRCICFHVSHSNSPHTQIPALFTSPYSPAIKQKVSYLFDLLLVPKGSNLLFPTNCHSTRNIKVCISYLEIRISSEFTLHTWKKALYKSFTLWPLWGLQMINKNASWHKLDVINSLQLITNDVYTL